MTWFFPLIKHKLIDGGERWKSEWDIMQPLSGCKFWPSVATHGNLHAIDDSVLLQKSKEQVINKFYMLL